jgi:diaminopimelate decarboxylase
MGLRRCEMYRKAFPMTEVALPAYALRNRAVAKWVREHGLAVDVRSGEELAVAIAAGIHLMRLTVHADGMSDSELRATAHLAPGRVAVSSMTHVDLLASAVDHRAQGIVVRVTDFAAPVLTVAGPRLVRGFGVNTSALDNAIAAIQTGKRFNLVGLHCDVGSQKHDFVSYPAAIGQMITEMSQIRRHHGVVLTRLVLGGGSAVPSGDWAVELPMIARQIDESLDDACATVRYPRPMVVLSPGLTIMGQDAA